jgi:hypothetical protein
MTNKQIYAALSKIAGHRCADGKSFLMTRRVTAVHLHLIQQRLGTLLEKLHYDRVLRDFAPTYQAHNRMSARRARVLQRLRERHGLSLERDSALQLSRPCPQEERCEPGRGTVSPSTHVMPDVRLDPRSCGLSLGHAIRELNELTGQE